MLKPPTWNLSILLVVFIHKIQSVFYLVRECSQLLHQRGETIKLIVKLSYISKHQNPCLLEVLEEIKCIEVALISAKTTVGIKGVFEDYLWKVILFRLGSDKHVPTFILSHLFSHLFIHSLIQYLPSFFLCCRPWQSE
jgi:hypothetical protein